MSADIVAKVYLWVFLLTFILLEIVDIFIIMCINHSAGQVEIIFNQKQVETKWTDTHTWRLLYSYLPV